MVRPGAHDKGCTVKFSGIAAGTRKNCGSEPAGSTISHVHREDDMQNALLLLVLLAGLSGVCCASMVHGDFQEVLITSEPSGAAIYRGTQPLGTTPARVEFKRRDASIVLQVQKEGYGAQAIYVHRGLSRWVWTNFLIAGAETAAELFVPILIRLSIDFAGGGAYALRTPATAILTPQPQPDDR